jgi:peptidoglycan-N-acetylglucosamine deacetylase
MIKGQKYVLLTFDVESDVGSWTTEYRSIRQALPLIADELLKNEVRATFFYTACAAMQAPDVALSLVKQGHEIGCHGYYHESFGKPTYFIPGDHPLMPDEIYGRLIKATDVVERIVGIRPVSFRSPRLWGGVDLLAALEKLGYCTDSSYAVSSDKDSLFPYHPGKDDWTQPGKSKVLEIPVAGFFGDMCKTAADTAGQDYQIFDGKVLPQWPLLRMAGVQTFYEYLMQFSQAQLEKRPISILAIYLHPWEFMRIPEILEGPEASVHLARSLYFNCGQQVLQMLVELIRKLKQSGFSFVTASMLCEIWSKYFKTPNNSSHR